ncbi:hypothetical protein DSO57_1029652 [Entomophthora muscae]|uniref:Uncharacterized protein n=1 Tax=Entomophthora muscae TaxID=34485 RepID=A0ACC2RS10_9FUNG|nr:hypothetical protein DSO57_1029652 [Entomophthora muscae]
MSKQKLALITGGSRGIGLACGHKFASKGYSVLLVSRSKNISEIADQLPKANAGQLNAGLLCDLTDINSIKDLFKRIPEYGELDCLINNAGINKDGMLASLDVSYMNEVIATNVSGTLHVCKAASRYFIRKRQGNIINISSVLGLRGNIGQVTYSASKAAVIGLTRSLALELAQVNVRVNAIAPGYIETHMTKDFKLELKEKLFEKIPLKRFGLPEDVANAAWYINQANYLTGSVLTLDGGLSC